jgi:hypothetical protein
MLGRDIAAKDASMGNPHLARNVRLALERCVSNGRCEFLTYGQFGNRFGFNPRSIGPALEEVFSQFIAEDVPDLTFLLRNADHGYPSVINRRPAKPPSGDQILIARVEAQRIINVYCPGARNPY